MSWSTFGFWNFWNPMKFGRIHKCLQDSIPLGCILLAWKLYMLQFQLPPLDVTLGEGGWGPQINKVEQVSSDHHQMSLAGGRSPGLMSRRGWVPYHVTYSMMHLMLTTPPLGTDGRPWKHYHPATSFAGGNKYTNKQALDEIVKGSFFRGGATKIQTERSFFTVMWIQNVKCCKWLKFPVAGDLLPWM